MSIRPVDGQSASIRQHNHHRLTRGRQRFQQILLCLRKVQPRAIATLPPSLTGISSPSSSLVIPTTATATSTDFAGKSMLK
jgi:hypothetical protein